MPNQPLKWRRREGVIRHLLALLPMLALFLAGLAKLLALEDFEQVLGTWELIPRPLLPFLVLVIPSFELMCGGLWLIGAWRRRMLFCALVFIFITTFAYGSHVLWAQPPDCACFGFLARYEWSQQVASRVLARNAILAFLLVGALRLSRPGAIAPLPPHECESPRKSFSRGAFTVIELVLIIALIAILLMLVLPSLSGARLTARVGASSGRIRSHAAIFQMYATDNRGFMPYVTDPRAHYTILRAGNVVYAALYFEAVNQWHLALAPAYYDDDPFHESFFFPGEPKRELTIYNYSQVFLADPAYWRETTRVGPAQWRAVRAHEVVFPASKALLVDSESERLRRRDEREIGGAPVLTAFADSSARQIPLHKFTRGYRNQTGWEWHGVYNTVLSQGMHTIDGVRGRDVE